MYPRSSNAVLLKRKVALGSLPLALLSQRSAGNDSWDREARTAAEPLLPVAVAALIVAAGRLDLDEHRLVR